MVAGRTTPDVEGRRPRAAPLRLLEFPRRRSDAAGGLRHGAHAARAGVDALERAVDHDVGPLDVRPEDPLGFLVREADVVARLPRLPADIAHRHDRTPLYARPAGSVSCTASAPLIVIWRHPIVRATKQQEAAATRNDTQS